MIHRSLVSVGQVVYHRQTGLRGKVLGVVKTRYGTRWHFRVRWADKTVTVGSCASFRATKPTDLTNSKKSVSAARAAD